MVSLEEVKKLSALSRIALSDKEAEELRKDFDSILGYVDQIKKVSAALDAKKEAGALRNVFREDGEPHESGIFTEALLAAAPHREGGYVKVKKIL